MNEKIVHWIDRKFRKIDISHLGRTKNIRLIPDLKNRRGGKLAYGEWAHVIGIFQTIIYQTIDKKTGNDILDAGCGTGLLGIASEPFVTDAGTYTGIDVMTEDIRFCKEHYPFSNYHFIHLDVANPTYASMQASELKPWPIESKSQDLVTALSVWTHLSERDAQFYMKEVSRVLKPNGKAIITFFCLDEDYERSLPGRSNDKGRFHNTPQNEWIFDVNAYGSENWFATKWAVQPEDAIGVTRPGIDSILNDAGLKIDKYYPGNWKEKPGVFFQDIFVLEKANS
ncbi:MAG TPA: class I SAM-dependent methyltransferase [Mucilaginibacter sp.]|jgi:SAM-dependent methyltransferase|nr:class I SAM-dependent methyltransferase [Mucilaginibacter sp.]